MKKLDNFTNCLPILANADFKLAETNDIYRTGIIGQLIVLIHDSFIPAFMVLKDILVKKLDEAENDWM